MNNDPFEDLGDIEKEMERKLRPMFEVAGIYIDRARMGTISSFLPATRDPNELALVLSFQSAQALGRAVAILLEDDPATRLMSRPGASDGKFHLLMLR